MTTAKDPQNVPASKTKSTRETRTTTEQDVSPIEPVAAMPSGGDVYPKYDDKGNVVEPEQDEDEAKSDKS